MEPDDPVEEMTMEPDLEKDAEAVGDATEVEDTVDEISSAPDGEDDAETRIRRDDGAISDPEADANDFAGEEREANTGETVFNAYTDETLFVDTKRSRAPVERRLLGVAGDLKGEAYPLDGEKFMLGRGQDCDLTIQHRSVSKRHA
ncbi:MAG: FHA domain-containing protein, partial [Desulfobacteraceae bacterium]|nr:FHA domain-containing protein [Desulfobacteraceae bacterium]